MRLANWCFLLFSTDLALLAVSALFSNTFSLIQQGNDISRYIEIVTTQFNNIKKNPSDPELAIAGGSFGVDLVLYYLRKWTQCVDSPFSRFDPNAVRQNIIPTAYKPCWSCFGMSASTVRVLCLFSS